MGSERVVVLGQGAWPRLLLALLALAVFATSFPGTYLLDDFPIIQDNPLVNEPHLKTILASDYWGPQANSRLHRPLTILSYALNRAWFGPAAFSFHLVNVLLHVGVTLLLYSVLLALGRGALVAWSAAALFAVHPIHTEVVDIITGRAELLAALFLFLGLSLAFRRGRLHHLWVGVSHAAALLSKETGAVFPLLLFLGDAFRERDWRALLRRRWRLYAQSVAVTLAWLAMRAALPSAGRMANTVRPLDNPLVDLAFVWRVFTTLKVQLLYLGKLLFPSRLHVVYVDRMMGPVTNLADPWWVIVLVAVAGLSGLCVLGWRRRRDYALGLAWYAAAFLVTANPLVLPEYLMAERFAYTPSAGFCLAAAALAGAFLEKIVDQNRRRRVAGAVLGVVLATLAARTLVRNLDFRDHVRLWEVETGNAPDNIRAWLFLSSAYQQRERWQDAERALQRAVLLDPGLAESWIMSGELYQRQGRDGEAQAAFRRSIETGMTTYEALEGYVVSSLRLGLPQDALALLQRVAGAYRDRGGYWHLLGMARQAAGDLEGAIDAYRTAIGTPDCPRETAEILRGLLIERGRNPDAVEVPR